jgi:hypothetical protein
MTPPGHFSWQRGNAILPAVAIAFKNGHEKNMTPCNNQKNTSDDDKKKWVCRKINDSIQQSTSTPCVCLLEEWNQGGKNLFWMAADGRAKQNRMAISQQCQRRIPLPGLGDGLHSDSGAS